MNTQWTKSVLAVNKNASVNYDVLSGFDISVKFKS